MRDRNDEPPYPTDAIALLKTDHWKVKNLFTRYTYCISQYNFFGDKQLRLLDIIGDKYILAVC